MIPQAQIKIQDFSGQQRMKKSSPNSPFLIVRSTLPNKKLFKFEGKWSQIQIARYIAFVQHNLIKIEGGAFRELWPLFHEMASFIASRNFRQCKSYHQALLKKYGNTSNILKQLIKQNLNFEPLVNQCRGQAKQFRYVSPPKFVYFDLFPSNFTKTNISEQNQFGSTYPQFWCKNLHKSPYISKQDQKRKEWLECHQLFTQWIQKWNSLVADFRLISPSHRISKLM